MAQALDTLRNLDKCAELRRPQHLAMDHVAHPVRGEEALPHVGLQLLDAQREAAVLRLDAENNSLHLFALLHHFRRMLDALGPAQVRDVNQTVDAVFNLDEGAKVGQVAHPALNDCPGRILLGQVLPRVVEQLFHAQRDAAVGRIHAQHHCIHLVGRLDQLGRMLEALRPGHFRKVNQPLDALLQLNERAVVGDRKNAAMDARAHRVALCRIQPRVRRQLLESQRNPLLVLVELEHLHLDLIAHIHQVAGMRQPAPAHVGNVQQAVDAAQIHERAVVG